MALDPTLGGQIEAAMRGLLNCLCAALGTVGWTGDCCVEPGEVAWDTFDGPDGRAWARLIEVFPTLNFPVQSGPVDPEDVRTTWAARVELGATVPVCDEGCGCSVREANARELLNAAESGLTGVACCGTYDARVVGMAVNGPEGGNAGFTIQLIVPVDICC